MPTQRNLSFFDGLEIRPFDPFNPKTDLDRMIDSKQDFQDQSSQRKSNYVDASEQGSLLRRIVYHWVIFFGVAGLSAILVQALLGDTRVNLSTRIQAAAEEYAFFVLVVFAIFPAFLLDTIRFSNRFVGPMVRLRRKLHELGTEGETSSMNLRDDDFWSEICSEFNTVRDVVREQQIEIDELRTRLAEQETSSAERARPVPHDSSSCPEPPTHSTVDSVTPLAQG